MISNRKDWSIRNKNKIRNCSVPSQLQVKLINYYTNL